MKAQFTGQLTSIKTMTSEQRRAERNRKQRERYATDPEFRAKRAAATLAWDKKNPERLAEHRARWRAKNPDKVQAIIQRAAQARNLNKKTDDGHIYIFSTQANGPYKIGYTGRAVKYRMYEAQRDNFNPVEVIYTSEFIKNARQLETELHTMFKNKCVRGEWYDLNKTNIKNLKTLVNKRVG